VPLELLGLRWKQDYSRGLETATVVLSVSWMVINVC
jgi:hypothetical protein